MKTLAELEQIIKNQHQAIKDQINYLPLYMCINGDSSGIPEDLLNEDALSAKQQAILAAKDGLEITDGYIDPLKEEIIKFKVSLARHLQSMVVYNTDSDSIEISILNLIYDIYKSNHPLDNMPDIGNDQLITNYLFLNKDKLGLVEQILITDLHKKVNAEDFVKQDEPLLTIFELSLNNRYISDILKKINYSKHGSIHNKHYSIHDNNEFDSLTLPPRGNIEPLILSDQQQNNYIYDQKSPLGAGLNGKTYLAINIDTGEKAVIKIVPQEKRAQLQQEHQNSLQYFIDGKPYAQIFGNGAGGSGILVLQYITGKPFGNNANNTGAVNDAYKSMQECLAIAQELNKLHQEFKLYHGDITPENVFIYYDEKNLPHAVFLDFAAAKNTTHNTGLAGYSPIYTSPEIIKKIMYNYLEINSKALPLTMFTNIKSYIEKIQESIARAPESCAIYEEELKELQDAEKFGLSKEQEYRKKEINLIFDSQKKTINILKYEKKQLESIIQTPGATSIKDQLVKIQIDKAIEELHKLPYNCLDLKYVEFEYEAAQDIFSLGKVFEIKSINNPAFKNLVTAMTAEDASKRPNLDDVITKLQAALQAKYEFKRRYKT